MEVHVTQEHTTLQYLKKYHEGLLEISKFWFWYWAYLRDLII